MELIKRGSRNDTVRQLQEKLNKLGYNLDVDGIFGGGCHNAVLDFQNKNGLGTDGIVGTGTWNAIDLVLKATTESASTATELNATIEGDQLVNKDKLARVMPKAKAADLDKYLEAINEGLTKYSINTPLRIAHFVAQVAHESGSFKYSSENLNYGAKGLRSTFGKYFKTDELAEEYARQKEKIANRVYGNRMGNGDENSGDGWRFRGRGLIQLTGKENYQKCAKDIGIDIDRQPDKLATDPKAAVFAAAWFWNSRRLNNYADKDDVLTITKRINGGTHGLDDRKAYLERAKKAFNLA